MDMAIALIAISIGISAVVAYFVMYPPTAIPDVFTGVKDSVVNTVEDIQTGVEAASKPVDVQAYEREIVDLVNEERAARDLRTLQYDERLADVGRDHSAWMAETSIFEHSGNQYYNCMGENIAVQTRSLMTPQEVVDLWMDSKGHRDAILFTTHIGAGAGIAQAANGDAYYTLIMDSTLC